MPYPKKLIHDGVSEIDDKILNADAKPVRNEAQSRDGDESLEEIQPLNRNGEFLIETARRIRLPGAQSGF